MSNKRVKKERIINAIRTGHFDTNKDRLKVMRSRNIIMLELVEFTEGQGYYNGEKMFRFRDCYGREASIASSNIHKIEDYYYCGHVRASRSSSVCGVDISNSYGFSFHILNKSLDKNMNIHDRRPSQTYARELEMWKYAKRYNIKSKIANFGELQFIGNKLYYLANRNSRKAIIPGKADGILSPAFHGCNILESIEYIPSCSIPNDFANSSGITEIVIRGNVNNIGDRAFSSCHNLRHIEIPASVKRIGSRAFADCDNLESVVFNNDIRYIGEAAFHGCTNLTSITIPNGISVINDFTFVNCHKLKRIFIPKSTKSFGSMVFHGISNEAVIEYPEHLRDYFEGSKQKNISSVKLNGRPYKV